MDKDIRLALDTYKKAKKLVELDKQRIIISLPENVANTLWYDGPFRAKEIYPEYSEVFDEFINDLRK
jgi:hypothetical protein